MEKCCNGSGNNTICGLCRVVTGYDGIGEYSWKEKVKLVVLMVEIKSSNINDVSVADCNKMINLCYTFES